MKSLSSLIGATLLLSVSASQGQAYDTINCARDHGPAERTICADQRLQVLDAQVTERYTDIMLDAYVSGSTKRALHDSQVAFLKRREQCGHDADCLTEVMQRRVTRIGFYR